MNDDKLIKLADSYVEEVWDAEQRIDVQHLLRLIALRAALLEVQLMQGGYDAKS